MRAKNFESKYIRNITYNVVKAAKNKKLHEPIEIALSRF